MAHDEDYSDDSTVEEIHQIREEFSRQQKQSGLSYIEWLKATEPDLRKSLAEVGFRMVTRNGRLFLYEIRPASKNNNGKLKTAKHKNYDDVIENSAVQEFQGVREERASPDKIEPQPQKQPVKYKHKAVSNSGSSVFRKKRKK